MIECNNLSASGVEGHQVNGLVPELHLCFKLFKG
jgi:hypothetical protein